MKAAFYTLGCKVNQYESQEMSERLKTEGYDIVNSKEAADVYVINSCTVTAESTRKTRQAVRRFKQTHPDSAVVLTGCVPQAFPREALSVEEADIVIGNKNNHKLPRLLKQWFSDRKRIIAAEPHNKDDKFVCTSISVFSEHTRAFVKIQDGCNRFCSYCAIPFARGRSRSRELNSIKDEIKTLAGNGYKEIVFVGINLSAYGRDIGLSLTDAVAAANETEGIERIRLGSLEPDHITDDIIEKLAEFPKFCPQFHISLQSGCDTVLKRMNRHYNSEEYENLVKKLRSVFPEASITTDIIAGFPGETQEEFVTTLKFVEKIKFEKVHVFPYSRREGTRAASLPDHLSNTEKSHRASVLSEVCSKIRTEYFKSLINKTFSVLFEAPKNGYQCGYTKNYTPVKVKSDRPLTGRILNIRIIDTENDYCIGELTD